MTAPDDLGALMARVALHDRAAFERVYRATSAHLLGVALRILGSRERAEEVLQEAFVNVWHGARGYNPSVATPMTWLINIVRNKSIDTLRSGAGERRSTSALEDEALEVRADPQLEPQQLLDASLQRAHIEACMAALNPQQRQALALAYYKGLVHSEIAQQMGAPLGTAKAWVRRGLDKLKDCLGARGAHDDPGRTDMNLLQPERLDRLAREYALGTLQGAARRRFERLLREAPLTMRVVAHWQERLGVLAAGVPAVQPREQVWEGLQQRLFAAPRHAGFWQRVQGLLAPRVLGGVLAGVLMATVVLRLQPQWLDLEPHSEALPQSYVGLLVSEAGQATLLASSRRHGRSITVKLLQPIDVPSGQVARLWALPREGAPFLVGEVPAKGSATIGLPDSAEKLFFTVARLGVTIEPAGGDARAPAGPFVASGHCVKLW